jgi:hydrophobic/amphiphilic exporter-1 (mainly G- bacteria), HAE1 family
MISKFIHRPVLSIVVSLIIVLIGILAIFRLPLTLFPSVAPPEVNVTVEYPGANAETVMKAAVIPIERALNGVPGMKYMTSDAGNDGVGVIEVLFDVGTNAELAGVNVQNRVATVMSRLPADVVKNGVKIGKEENQMLMYINVFSRDTTFDTKFIFNFADINILSELKRIKGIGYADILGDREYAMRVWLKPDRMLTYKVSPQDVLDALEDNNVEAAPGKIGECSDKLEISHEYIIKYTGKFDTQEEYENIPLKSNVDGQILKLKDVADIEFGSMFYDVESRFNNRHSAAIVLKQLPGTNASDVIKRVKQRMAEIKDQKFLTGMDYEVSFDVSRFLDASVHEVIKTLIEAFLLVSIVVFIFLQDFRSTLIPAIAVPVSLIGTFSFMQIFGFSLNLITLFALVLSIGIVVDNAIVVVEAVYSKMEHSNMGPMKATEKAMKEISGAIIAITLVMSAVFIPVSFMSGPSGIFYRQFSITMAIAIILSGVIALTLTPALCALILRNKNVLNRKKRGAVYKFLDGFNNQYNNVSRRYQRLIGVLAGRQLVTFGILIAFCAGVGILGKIVHSGFIPEEDQGTFYIAVTTPAGSTLERTKAVIGQINEVCKGVDAIESVSSNAGNNILTDGEGGTYGSCLVNLKNWDKRKQSADEVMAEIKERTKNIKDARLEFFPPPAIPGYGNASGFELRLLDQTGNGDIQKFGEVANQFVKDLNQRNEISSAFTIFDASFPQYLLHVDLDKATQKGISVDKAMSTLQTLIGSDYATDFIKFGQVYRVMVQASPEYRSKPDDILKLYAKNDKGDMIQYSEFASMEKVYGMDDITHFNLYPSAEISGDASKGYSSGSAINAIKETARTKLPKGYGIDWAGISRDEVNVGNEAIIIFIICLLFVYLLLSAQYESFILPLAVILSLPAGIFGAYFFLLIFGLENNIYAQIAMIMLIGLLGKNAILIVEFASMKHREGKRPFIAAISGAMIRLRPILMTSFAFVAGMIPLLFRSGAGAVSNRTIGAAAAGGMLFGTIFGVIVIPGLYVVFATIAEKFSMNKRKEELALTEEK